MRTPLFIPALALSVALAAGTRAQTATDGNLGSTLSADSSTTPPTYTFSWWGKSGFHYIVETNPDLLSPWVFLPNYNPSGADAVLGVQFTTDSDRYFFRVTQFDPNDITALTDSDGDGLADKWEQYYFGDLSRDGSGDFDGDGLSDRFEFQGGGNPIADPETLAADRVNFTYDALGRVGSLTAPLSMSFDFDAEGNLKAVR
jgi:hypothetical protein